MKKIILIILLFFFILPESYGCHLAGGQITYTHLYGLTYKVRVTVYEECDCSSDVEDGDDQIEIELSSSCFVDHHFDLDFISSSPVDFTCNQVPTQCVEQSGITYDGFYAIEEKIFEGEIEIPEPCDDIIFSYSTGDRTDTDYTPIETFYIYAGLNLEQGHNDSPQFGVQPFLYACKNEPFTYDNAITEADGDVITYSLVCPKIDENTSLTYSNSQTCGNPLPVVTPFSFDSNGLLTFESNANNKFSVIAMMIKEFRNGELIGFVVRDMLVYVYDCNNELPDATGIYGNSGDVNIFGEIVSFDGGSNECFTIYTTDPDYENGDVMEIEIIDMPNFATVTYSTDANGIASAEICLDTPADCESSVHQLKVKIKDGNCDIPGTVFKNYTLIIEPKPPCEENLYFTNRNLTTGIPMPSFAQASNEIWVGDDMPPGYSGAIPEGPVYHDGDVELVAGNGINLPSCQTGSACVTITGTQTLYLVDTPCISSCPSEPLVMENAEYFSCIGQVLFANVEGGVMPYDITWYNTDTGQEIGKGEALDISFIVQNQYTPLNYSVTVVDANGDYLTYSDEVLGVKKFYEPITNAMFNFSNTAEPLYLYNAHFLVDNVEPFYIYDGVSTDPPWYNATWVDFYIFDHNGAVLHNYEETVGLSNTAITDDWSIDNYSLFWNGGLNNDPSSCVSNTDIYDYALYAENCVSEHFEVTWDQPDIFNEWEYQDPPLILLECYMGDWTNYIWYAKSNMDSQYGEIYLKRSNKYLNESKDNEDQETVDAQPNPANEIVTLISSNFIIQSVKFYDIAGNLILNEENFQGVIDISFLPKGVYLLEIYSENDVTYKKLIVE